MDYIEKIRKEFPQLETQVDGKNLIYFDSAATTLKHQDVIQEVARYYQFETTNVHRGVHTLSQNATLKYENTRSNIQHYINAEHAYEIIFTGGTTDGINLVASSFGEAFINKGDEILLTELEHHSNIVPWQLIAEKRQAKIKVIPITQDGDLDLSKLDELITEKTKILSVVAVSNSIGTINPIKEIITKAKAKGAKVLIDAAQLMGHQKIDVQELDCDFLACSGHKMYGPTGIGFLYGKGELLEKMPPYQGGGDMIETVTFEKTTYNQLPQKFEAGTPHIAGVLGLNQSINFLKGLDMKIIHSYEEELRDYGDKLLKDIPGLRIITPKNRGAVFSFTVEGIHPHDIGTLVAQEGIAIRTGHHCTQPAMKALGIDSTSRASLSFYNTKEEINIFKEALIKAISFFR